MEESILERKISVNFSLFVLLVSDYNSTLLFQLVSETSMNCAYESKLPIFCFMLLNISTLYIAMHMKLQNILAELIKNASNNS